MTSETLGVNEDIKMRANIKVYLVVCFIMLFFRIKKIPTLGRDFNIYKKFI